MLYLTALGFARATCVFATSTRNLRLIFKARKLGFIEPVQQIRGLAHGISFDWIAIAELRHGRPGDDDRRKGLL